MTRKPQDRKGDRIVRYLHCGKCLEALPYDMSPAEYGDLEVGWTKYGIQVYCNRHKANVIHIDFEGVKHKLIF